MESCYELLYTRRGLVNVQGAEERNKDPLSSRKEKEVKKEKKTRICLYLIDNKNISRRIFEEERRRKGKGSGRGERGGQERKEERRGQKKGGEGSGGKGRG